MVVDGMVKFYYVEAPGERAARSKAEHKARREYPLPAGVRVVNCEIVAQQVVMGGVLDD
jgi:hypothetical protein